MSVFRCFGNLCAKTKTDEAGSKSQIFPDVYRTSLAAGAGAGETQPRVSRENDEAASTSQPSATNSQAPKREPSVEHPRTPLTENFEVESELSRIDVEIADDEFDQIEGRRLRTEAPPPRGDGASTSGQQAHHRKGGSCGSPDGRPTPTNPVTFLQAVIDDVRNWQVQVAALQTASSNSQTNSQQKMSGDQLKEEMMKTSVGTLQRRNEELLGELDRLSSRLYRAEKEIARMQGRLDEYAHKENKESGRSSNGDRHSQVVDGSERGSEGSNHPTSVIDGEVATCTQESREESRNHRNAPDSDIGNGDQVGSSMAHDGSDIHGGSPNGLSKEDYFITENKCLKMWIAKMQASISHMETEVFAMRQEKSDLLDLLSQYSGLNKSNKRLQQPLATLPEVKPQSPPPPSPGLKPTKSRTPGMNPALNRLASRNARQSSRNARLRNMKSGGGGGVSGSMKREKSSDFESLGSASNYVSIDKDMDFDESIYKITPTWKP
ncbi:hypothetical protein BSKO_13602 [Bryopsis sp. KO-2023]|nr:hypothetical protein BSKO_13602 [Bryopsis sp. KO-2023]